MNAFMSLVMRNKINGTEGTQGTNGVSSASGKYQFSGVKIQAHVNELERDTYHVMTSPEEMRASLERAKNYPNFQQLKNCYQAYTNSNIAYQAALKDYEELKLSTDVTEEELTESYERLKAKVDNLNKMIKTFKTAAEIAAKEQQESEDSGHGEQTSEENNEEVAV